MIGRACPRYKVCLGNIHCMDCDGETMYIPEKKPFIRKSSGLGRGGEKTESKTIRKTNGYIKKGLKEAYAKSANTLTPNSGAGKIKGDGVTSDLMQEMKERNNTLKGGKKSISIQKEWLDKLRKESYEAGKSYYVLAFTFGEDEHKIYGAMDYETVMGMYEDIVYYKEREKILLEKVSELNNKISELENEE